MEHKQNNFIWHTLKDVQTRPSQHSIATRVNTNIFISKTKLPVMDDRASFLRSLFPKPLAVKPTWTAFCVVEIGLFWQN